MTGTCIPAPIHTTLLPPMAGAVLPTHILWPIPQEHLPQPAECMMHSPPPLPLPPPPVRPPPPSPAPSQVHAHTGRELLTRGLYRWGTYQGAWVSYYRRSHRCQPCTYPFQTASLHLHWWQGVSLDTPIKAISPPGTTLLHGPIKWLASCINSCGTYMHLPG